MTETTALGAAFLAGLGIGAYTSTADIEAAWRLERRFEPQLGAVARDARYARWQDAVAKARSRPTD